jgi:hypothetical protein
MNTTISLDIVNNRVGQEVFRMDYPMWDRIVVTIGTNRYRAVGEWLAANDPDTYAPIAERVRHA